MNKQTLQAVADQTTPETLEQQIERLKAENEALKQRSQAKVSGVIKVTEKGGCSVYGLGRFPVTLYKSQWHRLITMIPQIEAFLKEHDAELTEKAKVA